MFFFSTVSTAQSNTMAMQWFFTPKQPCVLWMVFQFLSPPGYPKVRKMFPFKINEECAYGRLFIL